MQVAHLVVFLLGLLTSALAARPPTQPHPFTPLTGEELECARFADKVVDATPDQLRAAGLPVDQCAQVFHYGADRVLVVPELEGLPARVWADVPLEELTL